MIPPHDATSGDSTVDSGAPLPSLARWYRASLPDPSQRAQQLERIAGALERTRRAGAGAIPRSAGAEDLPVGTAAATGASSPRRRDGALSPSAAAASRHAASPSLRLGGPWRWLGIAATLVVVAGATVYLNTLARDNSGRDGSTIAAATADAALAGAASPLRSTARRSPRTHDVGFALRLTDGSVRHVSLAGDFNEWDTSTLPMVRDPADGTWRVRVPLAPGRHTYSFVVDGTRWVIDPLAPRTVEGALGPANVIAVSGDS